MFIFALGTCLIEQSAGSEDSDGSVVNVKDKLMLELFEANPPNVLYDRLLPVHINPENTQKWFPITHEIATFWVSKLVSLALYTSCYSHLGAL